MKREAGCGEREGWATNAESGVICNLLSASASRTSASASSTFTFTAPVEELQALSDSRTILTRRNTIFDQVQRPLRTFSSTLTQGTSPGHSPTQNASSFGAKKAWPQVYFEAPLLERTITNIMSNYSSNPITAEGLGRAILRLAPLAISSASLMCAWDQQNAFRSFLAPTLLAKPNYAMSHIVVHWFAEFARPTKWVIMLSYPCALAIAFVNAFTAAGDGLHPHTKALYAAGGVLSILHFWFGAYSMMWNSRISTKENIGKANEDALRGWLRNNGTRMAWVNIPAWFMFLCASATFLDV
jgi:hypothetical protein